MHKTRAYKGAFLHPPLRTGIAFLRYSQEGPLEEDFETERKEAALPTLIRAKGYRGRS